MDWTKRRLCSSANRSTRSFNCRCLLHAVLHRTCCWPSLLICLTPFWVLRYHEGMHMMLSGMSTSAGTAMQTMDVRVPPLKPWGRSVLVIHVLPWSRHPKAPACRLLCQCVPLAARGAVAGIWPLSVPHACGCHGPLHHTLGCQLNPE
jgi:hypothetical protein